MFALENLCVIHWDLYNVIFLLSLWDSETVLRLHSFLSIQKMSWQIHVSEESLKVTENTSILIKNISGGNRTLWLIRKKCKKRLFASLVLIAQASWVLLGKQHLWCLMFPVIHSVFSVNSTHSLTVNKSQNYSPPT